MVLHVRDIANPDTLAQRRDVETVLKELGVTVDDGRRIIEVWNKADLLGVPVVSVDPAYTSQDCSRCGTRGNRDDKVFRCPSCGHLEHADVNAAFNVASRPPLDGECVVRLHADRDACKGSIDTPGGAPP